MAELKFGEVDWNEADVGSSGGKLNFARLEQGANTYRIMSSPIQFKVNWVDAPDGKRRKINTPIASPKLVQRLEDAGFKTQTRWFLKVLDRDDEQFKLLEVGPQILKAVRELVRNPKWGKVTKYDVTINKGPKGSQPLYTVFPNPHEPLNESLQSAWSDFNENLNIERLITPSEPDYVYELMGWNTPSSAVSNNSSDDDDDFEYDFSG